MSTHAKHKQAAHFIQARVIDCKPKLGIICGSGLSKLARHIKSASIIAFSDIPHFPRLSVSGHPGQLVLGSLAGLPIACLQGRPHFYEGYQHHSDQNNNNDYAHFMVPIQALHALGCTQLLILSASGSLRQSITPGQLVLIRDHINFQGTNPLIGTPSREFGSTFVSMENAYDPTLREQLKSAANHIGITLEEGVYIGVLGPSFETPAEIKLFQSWGADVIGMSTVPEVIIARHCQLQVAVVCAITNMAAGLSPTTLSHELTLQGAKQSEAELSQLVIAFAQQLNKP